MTRDEMKELANRMYAAANAGDLDAVDGIFAADFRSHPMGTTGAGAVKKAWAAIRVDWATGATTLDRMLCRAPSMAITLDSPMSAALAVP